MDLKVGWRPWGAFAFTVFILLTILFGVFLVPNSIAPPGPSIRIEGLNKQTGQWETSNLKGWKENNWIDFRLVFDQIPSGSQTYSVDVYHDNKRNTVTGFDQARNFYIKDGFTSSAVQPGGSWSGSGYSLGVSSAKYQTQGQEIKIYYTITVTLPNGHPSLIYIYWGAHIAIGASAWPGASLQSSSSPGQGNPSIMASDLTPTGVIKGYKWNDDDGDGSWDQEESGLGGWTITLSGPISLTTTTSSNGSYAFTGLPDGSYSVSETPRSGWIQTYPLSISYAIMIDGGNEHTGNNFGNRIERYTLTVNAAPTEALGGTFYITWMEDGVSRSGTFTTPATFSADEGTTATVSSPQSPIVGGDSRYVFLSCSPSSSIIMDADKAITLNYVKQYQVTFSQTSLDNSATGTVVTVNGTPLEYAGLPYIFWVNNGDSVTYAYQSTVPSSVSGKRFALKDIVGPVSPVTVNGPASITGNYKVQYLLTVTSVHDAPSPNSDWYDAGTSITASVTSPADDDGAGARFSCTGWIGTGSVPASGTGTTVTFTINAHSTITWSWIAQYQCTVTSSPATGSGFVTVDGVPVTTPYTAWWDSGSSHIIAANSPVAIVSGQSQYVWTSWSDGGARSHSIAPTAVTTLTASLQLQYYLSVSGGDGSGAGWYNSGASASSIASYVLDQVSGQSRSNLVSKTVDGSTTSLTRANTGTSTQSFTMSAYHSITWDYVTQYYLTVSGGNGITYGTSSPTSDNWYDGGQSTTVSSNWIWDVVSGQSRSAITNWQLDGVNQNPTRQYSGTLTTSSVSMSTYRTVTFVSVTQYYFRVSSAYDSPTGQGWYDSGTSVSSTVTRPFSGGTGIQYETTGWTGTGSLASGGSPGSSSSDSFTINAYSTCTWNWKTQYYLTVLSPYDTPGGQDWYDGGSIAHATLDDGVISGGIGIQYVFTSWSGDASGTGLTSNGILMNAPKTATANWKTQYRVTFGQSDVGGDFTGTVATIDGSNYGISALPVSFWCDDGSTHTFAFQSPLTVTTDVKQYIWISTTGLSDKQSGSITVSTSGSVTGNYKTQYLQTFDVSSNVKYHGTGTIVMVDGSPVVVSALPFTKWVDDGLTVTYSYSSIVASSVTGKQYRFDTVTGPSSPIMVSSANTITGNYKTQYYLTASSPYDSPTPPSGWSDEDTPITASVISPYAGPSGTQYVCTGWTGTGSVPTSGSGTSVGFTIDAPSTITWNWKIQYYLALATNPPGVTAPTGAGWYDSGSSASISTAQYVDILSGSSRYRFNGWTTGDMTEITNPSLASTTVKMDKAKTVTADYMTERNVTFKQSSVATDFTGVVVVIDGNNYGVTDLPAKFWWVAGSTHVFAFQSPLVVMANAEQYVWTSTSGLSALQGDSNFVVSSSGTVTGDYSTQFYLTVNSDHGSPFPPSDWYDEGTTIIAFVNTPADESGGSRYRCAGWIGTGDVPPSGSGSEVSFTITGPSSITWAWIEQYQLTLVSDPSGLGSPSGAGWYDAMANAVISTDETVDIVLDSSRYRFDSWSTDHMDEIADPLSISTTVVMDEPKTVTAGYRIQYKIMFDQSGVGPDFTGVILTLDGASYGFGTLPASLWCYEGEIHDFEFMAPLVAVSEAKQYVWSSTSGLSSARHGSITVTQYGIILADYGTQFYLTVVSPYDTPSGTGWYKEGDSAYATLTIGSVIDGAARYSFLCWSGDASGTGLRSDPIVMNAPKRAIASWMIEYYVVTFDKSPRQGAILIDGFEYQVLPVVLEWTPGSSHEVEISSQESGGEGIRYVFRNWSDGSTLTDRIITADSPGKIYVAYYELEYRLVVYSDHGVTTGTGWYKPGTEVAISVTPVSLRDDESGIEFSFKGWIGSGAGQKYTGSTNPATVVMTGPIEEYAQWDASMYYLEVVSPYGDPYGAGWYSAYSKARFGVSTPVDQGNDTLRVFLRWSGDSDATQPEAEIVMAKPMRVIASWQTQYLVTFNTMLPNRVVLKIPGIPEVLPKGGEMLEVYCPEGTIITAGPAPDAVEGAQGTRYVFAGWTIDSKPFTTEPSFSLKVDRPHSLAVNYDIEYMLIVRAVGVPDSFSASLSILAESGKAWIIGSTSPLQEWFEEGTILRLTISTPNRIGGGEWAIFKEWSGDVQGNEVTVSMPISTSRSVDAIFFVVNPVAQSLPFSILAGAISVLVSHLLAERLKSQAHGKAMPTILGIGVATVALGIAAFASTSIASQYQIDHAQLVDLSNWAVLFTGAETVAFLIGTMALAWRPLVTWKPEIPSIPTNPYGI